MLTTSALNVTGMHCPSCGLLIDEILEELAGVERSSTESARGRTSVAYDPTTITLDTIVAEISKLGYGATPTET